MEKHQRHLSYPVTVALAVVMVMLYFVLYKFSPLPGEWNDYFVNFSTLIAAGAAAIYSTLLWLHFGKDEFPRGIWRWFALAMWSWTVAEAIWAVAVLQTGEAPATSWADIFWMAGFVFMGASFFTQFNLLFPEGKKKLIRNFMISIGILLVLTVAGIFAVQLTGVQSEMSLAGKFVNIFYPLADLLVALAALRLSQIFGRGLWGRTWWGLLVFTVSDLLYTWLSITGIYASSVENGNPISLICDLLYLIAYLVVAVNCAGQLQLIRHGLQHTQTDQIIATQTA